MILTILLSILLGILLFISYIYFRIKFLIRRTDKIITANFKIDNIWSDVKYTRPLLAIAGERVFIIQPLKYWQISKILQLLVDANDKSLNLDQIIAQESFYPALTYIFLKNGEDPIALQKYLRKTMSYKQILRILRIIIIQNDIASFINIYKEIKIG